MTFLAETKPARSRFSSSRFVEERACTITARARRRVCRLTTARSWRLGESDLDEGFEGERCTAKVRDRLVDSDSRFVPFEAHRDERVERLGTDRGPFELGLHRLVPVKLVRAHVGMRFVRAHVGSFECVE